jgi:ATP-dependent Lon protease
MFEDNEVDADNGENVDLDVEEGENTPGDPEGEEADDLKVELIGGTDAGDDAESSVPVRRGEKFPNNLFIVPLKDFVVFPGLMMPIQLSTDRARKTVEQARTQSEYLGFLTTRDPNLDPSESEDLFPVGTLVRVAKVLNLPEGGMSILIQGIRRFRVDRFLRKSPYFITRVSYLRDLIDKNDQLDALARTVRELAARIVKGSDLFGDEFSAALAGMDSPKAIVDFTAAYFVRDFRERQKLLEIDSVYERLMAVAEILTREVDLLEIGNKIQQQIREKIEKSQKEFFLREQIKAIREELGEALDEQAIEEEKYRKLVSEAGMPDEAREKAEAELDRLKRMVMESAESAVIRNYLDWLTSLPWSKGTRDNGNIAKAQRILEKDHHGLKDVKARILEFLSVRKLKPDHKGSIICFVGPPGTGKTSLGRSIAGALGRKFLRISLGGIRDEAEIRGHRRTYIGAMPGRIIQGLKQTGSNNPVFMLDEIDKLGADFRGDPSSALLEALDPEQNVNFSDHYIETPFDLSRVMFITTANTLATIPAPLLDRMEVIELNGYMLEEKIAIAGDFLIPRQLEAHGLGSKQLKITGAAVRNIVSGYTREAGVRGLEKAIAKLARKTAARIARKRSHTNSVTAKNLEKYLGPPLFYNEVRARVHAPGVAVGLAWTPVGGEVLFIESLLVEGAGKGLQITGKLGDVMVESAKIAISVVRANAASFGIAAEKFSGAELHIHVPSGAIPKDGPSAGITLAISLISLLTGRRMKRGLAMTGELTLTGKVLPVGGVRDKILAARRVGIREIILPTFNESAVGEVPRQLRKGLKFHFVDRFREVFELAF